MKTRHTPGPWDVRILSKEPGFAVRVGVVQHGAHFVSKDAVEAEQSANARLIAAAPELLARLNEAVMYLRQSDFGPVCRELLDSFQKTIAKAEGNGK